MTFRYCPLSHVFGFTLFIFVIITLLTVISTLVDIDELAKLYYILSVPTIITGICSACLSVKYANAPFRRLATTSILGGLIVFIYALLCSTFVFTSSNYHPEECGISGDSQFIEDLTISATLGGIGILLTLLAALIAPCFPCGKKGRLQRRA